jgi:hypothetical protein
MSNFSIPTGAVLALSIAAWSDAAALTVVKPVDNLMCMDLNMSFEDMRVESNLPLEYAEPTDKSIVVGNAMSIVFVVKPAKSVNGFLEVVRPNWQHAWIKANVLKAHEFHSPYATKCSAAAMSDGSLGFGPDH